MQTRTGVRQLGFSAFLCCLIALVGCGPADDPDQAETLTGPEFDLGEVGLRGMAWNGEATLLDSGLVFPQARLELGTIAFSLGTEGRDMSEFDNPPLEFRGEPVTMSLRIGGVVQDHEPGKFSVEISSVRVGFSGGVGTNAAEQLIRDLESNGVTVPEIDRDDRPIVTFEVSAADEDYTEIRLTSDVDYIQLIDMRDGERAAL